MAANPIWIAAYGGPPPVAIGAAPVWIAPGDGSVPSAAASWIAGYGGPVAGASPVWIAGYGGPVAGATPITLVGYGGSGGSGGGGTTSVWSAADATANGMTLTNGGLTVTPTNSGNWQSIRSSVGKTAGQLYVEFSAVTASPSADLIFGLAASDILPPDPVGTTGHSGGVWPNSTTLVSTGFTSNYTSTLADQVTGDVFAFAVDFTAGKIWLARNNVWSNSSNPATGSTPVMSFTAATVGALFATLSLRTTASGTWTLQATAASQTYAPPAGFTPWG